MGTRAAFWLDDPRNIETRQWLGCKAWDGYPDGLPELSSVKTIDDFKSVVSDLSKHDDFAVPSGGWPYPWDDDIFLTDYTYAFFDGKVQVACFHSGFIPFSEAIAESKENDPFDRFDDALSHSVPAPKSYDAKQPDSIIVVRAG